jgi:hypothetical protein
MKLEVTEPLPQPKRESLLVKTWIRRRPSLGNQIGTTTK